MPVVSAPHELLESDIYVDLKSLLNRNLFLKCEGFNFGSSLKLRSAAAMVATAERDGLLRPDSVIVESSSGNMGMALAVIAASEGLSFTCVTDIRCNPSTIHLMRVLGATVVVVTEPAPEGGLLRARLDEVDRRCRMDDRHVWLNQYVNPANWLAHYETTAPAIAKQIPTLDVLFVGAGTGGTLMGCARYFQDNASRVRVVAVDAVGSVSFGGEAAPRMIPGLGASVVPPLVDPELVDGVVHVPEIDTIRMCRALSACGMLLGGSTGTVVSGALSWLDQHDPDQLLTAVAISPDLGERYLNTVYNDDWVTEHIGPDALKPLVLG